MAERDATPEMTVLDGLIRKAVRYEFEARGLRKNGESWKAYALRQITPERIGLIALLIFQFGGGVRDARQQLKDATAQSVAASAKADAASDKADTVAKALEQTQVKVDRAVEEINRQGEMAKDLKDSVAMSVKRPEFQSAIQQQVLPRLARIEQWMWEGRR